MRKKLELIQALKINGVVKKELEYDTALINGEQFQEADARAHVKAAQLGKPNIAVVETDSSMQYYLGIMAIIAVNPEIDVTDLERIQGPDIMHLYRIGRNFTKGSAEVEESTENPDSTENNLEEPTEATLEHTTAVSKSSKSSHS